MALLLACVPVVWDGILKCVIKNTDWNGWLLTYVTKVCFPERNIRSVGTYFQLLHQKVDNFVWRKLSRDQSEYRNGAEFHELFSAAHDICVIKSAFPDQSNSNFAANTKAVLIHQNTLSPLFTSNESSTPLLSIVAHDNSTWDLQYVAFSSRGDQNNKWTSTVFC